MTEQWIIRVQGKEYGPADLATLQEWKSEGRLLATNPARRLDADSWRTASEIPGLFRREAPPVQIEVKRERPEVSRPRSSVSSQRDREQNEISNQEVDVKPPSRSILIETFRIYFRGFFQFFALSFLTALPSLCGKVIGFTIETRADMNPELRTTVSGAFTICMFVLTLVLWPIYVAGIQILTAELTAGRRVRFSGVLNHAVKYWPRVASLCVFVYVVFILLIFFGILVLSMTLAAGVAGSFFWIIVALGLAALQIWLFCRFFVFTLFWQQFAVLANLPSFEALQESGTLAHSGGNLPWYRRPLWRAALIVSIWIAFLIAIASIDVWPRLVADWPMIRDYFNQLTQTQDPQAVLQKINSSLQTSPELDYRALALNIGERILQPLLGIAFVVLYLDSRREDES